MKDEALKVECLFSFSERNRSRFSPAWFRAGENITSYECCLFPDQCDFTLKFWFNQKKLLHCDGLTQNWIHFAFCWSLNWQLLEFHLSKCCLFFSLTFKVTQGNSCFTCAWQLDLHPACPNIFGSSGKQMVIAEVFKPIFMQGEIGNGWRIRSLCAPMFHAQTFFFFFFYSWKKCLHRWDAVWVCLLLLWLLFVHERASSVFFH